MSKTEPKATKTSPACSNANFKASEVASSNQDLSEVSLESKIKQLDESVNWFYGDDFSLDQALDHYQASIKLAEQIEQDLTELKNQVEVIADFTKS